MDVVVVEYLVGLFVKVILVNNQDVSLNLFVETEKGKMESNAIQVIKKAVQIVEYYLDISVRNFKALNQSALLIQKPVKMGYSSLT